MEKLSIVYPPSYESSKARRFPLLLNLGDLNAAATAARLHKEGILTEVVVANAHNETASLDGLVAELSVCCRLLDHSSTRWIVGSAHSAVVAMNAVLDHPTVFGRVACLSTSFEGVEGAPPLHSRILRALEERVVLPAGVRLYFDYGTTGLDECYEPYHRDLGAILRSKGWHDGLEFQITRQAGGTHDIESWNTRLDPALRWLAAR